MADRSDLPPMVASWMVSQYNAIHEQDNIRAFGVDAPPVLVIEKDLTDPDLHKFLISFERTTTDFLTEEEVLTLLPPDDDDEQNSGLSVNLIGPSNDRYVQAQLTWKETSPIDPHLHSFQLSGEAWEELIDDNMLYRGDNVLPFAGRIYDGLWFTVLKPSEWE